MHLIVGLGNPGPEYTQTRHNAGFMAIEHCSLQWLISAKSESKFKAIVGKGLISGTANKIILAEPLTFMNLSGESVRALSDYYNIPPERVLIVLDDFALPVGKLRLRPHGSDGGHNGLKSITKHLGTNQYPRLRLGIGQPEGGFKSANHQTSYVLGRFLAEEATIFNRVLNKAEQCITQWVQEGIQPTMCQFNGFDGRNPL